MLEIMAHIAVLRDIASQGHYVVDVALMNPLEHVVNVLSGRCDAGEVGHDGYAVQVLDV